MEATPLVHDGVMYVSGSWSIVMALDARSGKELWRFDPKVSGRAGAHACCDVVNRGVALYEGRVYVGTLDGRLIALDARTGTPDLGGADDRSEAGLRDHRRARAS